MLGWMTNMGNVCACWRLGRGVLMRRRRRVGATRGIVWRVRSRVIGRMIKAW